MDPNHQRDREIEDSRKPLPSIGDTYSATVAGHTAAVTTFHTTPKIHFRKKSNNDHKPGKTTSNGEQPKHIPPICRSPERPTSGPFGDLRHDELDTEIPAPPPPKPLKKVHGRPKSEKRKPPGEVTTSNDGMPPWRPAGLAIGKPYPRHLVFDTAPRLYRRRDRIPAFDPIPPIKQSRNKPDHGSTRTVAGCGTHTNRNRHHSCMESMDTWKSDFDIRHLRTGIEKEAQIRGNRDGTHKPTKVCPRIARNKLLESDSDGLLSSCHKLLKEAAEKVNDKQNKETEELQVKGLPIPSNSATTRHNHAEGDDESNHQLQQSFGTSGPDCPCWKDCVHSSNERERVIQPHSTCMVQCKSKRGEHRLRQTVSFSDVTHTREVQRENSNNQTESERNGVHSVEPGYREGAVSKVIDTQANNSNHISTSLSHSSEISEYSQDSWNKNRQNDDTSKDRELFVHVDERNDVKDSKETRGEEQESHMNDGTSLEVSCESDDSDSVGLNKEEKISPHLDGSINMISQDIASTQEAVTEVATRIHEIPSEVTSRISDEIIDCYEMEEETMLPEEEGTCKFTNPATYQYTTPETSSEETQANDGSTLSLKVTEPQATTIDTEENCESATDATKVSDSQNDDHNNCQEIVDIDAPKEDTSPIAIDKENNVNEEDEDFDCERNTLEKSEDESPGDVTTEVVSGSASYAMDLDPQERKNTSTIDKSSDIGDGDNNGLSPADADDEHDDDDADIDIPAEEEIKMEIEGKRSEDLNTVSSDNGVTKDIPDVDFGNQHCEEHKSCKTENQKLENMVESDDQNKISEDDVSEDHLQCRNHQDNEELSSVICERSDEIFIRDSQVSLPIARVPTPHETDDLCPTANENSQTLSKNCENNCAQSTRVQLQQSKSVTGMTFTGNGGCRKLRPCWSTFDFTRRRPNSTPARAYQIHDYFQFYAPPGNSQSNDKNPRSNLVIQSLNTVSKEAEKPGPSSTAQDDNLSRDSTQPIAPNMNIPSAEPLPHAEDLESPLQVPDAVLSFPQETGFTEFDCAFQSINILNYYSNLMARYTYRSQNTIRAALEKMPVDDDEMHLHATTCSQAKKCAQEVQRYLKDYQDVFMRFFEVEEAQDEFVRYVSDFRNFEKWRSQNGTDQAAGSQSPTPESKGSQVEESKVPEEGTMISRAPLICQSSTSTPISCDKEVHDTDENL